jgi:hypothetical protein
MRSNLALLVASLAAALVTTTAGVVATAAFTPVPTTASLAVPACPNSTNWDDAAQKCVAGVVTG